jgi:hypothetical protein
VEAVVAPLLDIQMLLLLLRLLLQDLCYQLTQELDLLLLLLLLGHCQDCCCCPYVLQGHCC